jgi:flavin reductase (DIM6/NTAB) family NADH-FMN oxidoreductase RutF
VAVVTVQEGTKSRAITVNSLTSVSLDPPILLVCFDRRSASLKALQSNKSFGISILTKHQQDLAARFGQRETRENPHTIEMKLCEELAGVPTVAGALARIVCELEHSLEAGSHTVIFGAPRQVALHDSISGKRALGYWRSKFVEVAPQ